MDINVIQRPDPIWALMPPRGGDRGASFLDLSLLGPWEGSPTHHHLCPQIGVPHTPPLPNPAPVSPTVSPTHCLSQPNTTVPK